MCLLFPRAIWLSSFTFSKAVQHLNWTALKLNWTWIIVTNLNIPSGSHILHTFIASLIILSGSHILCASSITTSPFSLKTTTTESSYTSSISLFSGLMICHGLEVAMVGRVWSCAQCIGNVWLPIFASGDVGATYFAGMAGCPISQIFWLVALNCRTEMSMVSEISHSRFGLHLITSCCMGHLTTFCKKKNNTSRMLRRG